jgi:hypothetical protein
MLSENIVGEDVTLVDSCWVACVVICADQFRGGKTDHCSEPSWICRNKAVGLNRGRGLESCIGGRDWVW